MNTPPHSVAPLPAPLKEDLFTSRNNFLLLLLGVIATAERVLNVMPQLATENSDGEPTAAFGGPIKPEANHESKPSLLR